LKIITVRQILLKALDDERSDADTKELCLRVLLRLAVVSKNPETLLLLARYQKKLNIELVEEVVPLCDMDEVIEDEVKEIISSKFTRKAITEISQSVPISQDTNGSVNTTFEIVNDWDSIVADEKHFYIYNETRGLCKAIKGRRGVLKRVVQENKEVKGMESVSMVLHQGRLLIRHAGLKD
jgi:hypothetical protein